MIFLTIINFRQRIVSIISYLYLLFAHFLWVLGIIFIRLLWNLEEIEDQISIIIFHLSNLCCSLVPLICTTKNNEKVHDFLLTSFCKIFVEKKFSFSEYVERGGHARCFFAVNISGENFCVSRF